jgi:hypothetical protein
MHRFLGKSIWKNIPFESKMSDDVERLPEGSTARPANRPAGLFSAPALEAGL